MRQIKVSGPGWTGCEPTAQMVQDAAKELGIEVDVEKVTEPRAIAMAGVMSTPGISVDGKLVHSGDLPEAAKLDGWLS